MSDDLSPRLELPLLVAGQAHKEIFHNEALIRLDALVQTVAVSADVAMPPTSPLPGQMWVIGTGATGAWAGHDGKIASWSGSGWILLGAREGWQVHVLDRGHALRHDGSGWLDSQVQENGYFIAGERVVAARQPAIADPGGGATIDTEARATIAAMLSAMRAHGLVAVA